MSILPLTHCHQVSFLYNVYVQSVLNGRPYSSLQPTYFPGFAFSWLSLISHRLFMPKLFLSENREVCSVDNFLLYVLKVR
jgi:hypothetical protein